MLLQTLHATPLPPCHLALSLDNVSLPALICQGQALHFDSDADGDSDSDWDSDSKCVSKLEPMCVH